MQVLVQLFGNITPFGYLVGVVGRSQKTMKVSWIKHCPQNKEEKKTITLKVLKYATVLILM